MSKIYFNTGEKEKLKKNINKEEVSEINIELIKKHYKYKDMLFQHTTVSSSLIDIIFEYTHEIIMIKYFQDHNLCYITLYKNVMLYIYNTRNTKSNYNIYLINNYYINSLFVYKEAKLNNKYILTPEMIINKNYKGDPGASYSLNNFINYYMKRYYNKHIPYINQVDKCYDDHGIYNNMYYQVYFKGKKHIYYQIMQMLDHRKIKQMIVIIKIFIDLLHKYKH